MLLMLVFLLQQAVVYLIGAGVYCFGFPMPILVVLAFLASVSEICHMSLLFLVSVSSSSGFCFCD